MLVLPAVSQAVLVPCGVTDKEVLATHPTYDKACDFTAFMDLINNGIDFILKFLAIPIAAIMFTYAGFKLVTSGGNTEARGQAKKIFTNATLGLIFAAAAVLIIKTILIILGYQNIGLFFK